MADPAEPSPPPPENMPPVFETPRLRLRPWRETDAPAPGQGPDAASLRFMPTGAQPGPDDFPTWLARRRMDMATGSDLHWCITDLATDPWTAQKPQESPTSPESQTTRSMLGNVQIFRMGQPEGRFQGEVGYWLRPGARGRGVVGEALTPVIAHAFRPAADGGLGLTRLHAGTDSDNLISQSILRSAGFTQWGADHQAWRRADGSLSDGVYFELLAGGAPTASAPGSDQTTRETLEPITLAGNGIHLRAWRHTDAERVLQACSDQRTQHWLASLPSPYTLTDAQAYLAGRSLEAGQGRGLYWCVADSQSDQCLGSVALMDLDAALGTAGEVGYWAHPEARGRGVISAAVRLAVRHAFIAREDGGLGRRRLRLNAADGNSASQHIAVTNGFVQVGRDRMAEPLGDGTFADLVRFDLLVEEWNAAR